VFHSVMNRLFLVPSGLLSLLLFLTFLVKPTPAGADVIYSYVSLPLTAFRGSTLQGQSVHFEFFTPNPLPPNLSIPQPPVPPAPFYSVPVTDWSAAVGPYQVTESSRGGAGLLYLLFDTNALGNIVGWNLVLDKNTTDGTHPVIDLSILATSPPRWPARLVAQEASRSSGCLNSLRGRSYTAPRLNNGPSGETPAAQFI
jgi:hypothetical protein